MIDPKKVRLMTKLAVYEEGPGKKEYNCNNSGLFIRSWVVLLWNIHRYYFTGIEVPLSEIYSSCDDSLSDNIIIDLVCTRRYYTKVYDKMREDIKQYDYNLYRLARYIQKEEKDRA